MVMIGNKEIDFEVAVIYMDIEIREELHKVMAPCSEQDFIDAYGSAHESKYNEVFEVN